MYQEVITKLQQVINAIHELCKTTLNVVLAPATTENIEETYLYTTGAGTITSGVQKWSISNVGDNNAELDGQIFPPDATVTYEAYLDPVTNVYKRLSGLDWDAQTSILLIATTP